MRALSETADARTWTAPLTLKSKILPDRSSFDKHFAAMRSGARLRGIEATVRGRLLRRQGVLWLRASQTGELISLTPLKTKIQWEVARKRPEPPTEEEASAFARLETRDTAEATLYEVVGPIDFNKKGKPVALQVRLFRSVTR